MRNYIFYEDGAHGWLRVDRDELIELNIQAKITGYSYQKDDFVYLEEDQDLTTFCKAKFLNDMDSARRWFQSIPVKYSNYSNIRYYSSYDPKLLETPSYKLREV